MFKLLKIGNLVTINKDNEIIQIPNVDATLWEKLVNATDDTIEDIVFSEVYGKSNSNERIVNQTIYNKTANSNLLEYDEDRECVYYPTVSQLSVPQSLAIKILEAEENNDTRLIETYTNFWTLLSMNPDPECRQNLFWFLEHWGFRIAHCGFFVGYRNVCTTNEPGIYTDGYSHTFKIQVGEVVSMPRENCDCDSTISCSRGLHLGGTTWLNQNYFGDTGLACLCNPIDVVAVPHLDDYGKIRCCAYLPIDYVQFNEYGRIIPLDVEDGFDCSYVSKVIYEGLTATEKDATYKINLRGNNLEKKKNIDRLLAIAKECIVDSVIKYEKQEG